VSRAAVVQLEEKLAASRSELSLYAGRGLKGLQELAEARGSRSAEACLSEKRRKLDSEIQKRRSTLLRSTSLMQRRKTRPLEAFIDEVSKDMGISKMELRARLSLLSDIVPEFITILPPDDLVPSETLQVNMDTPYANVRRKLYK
jgi:hypothetical protein